MTPDRLNDLVRRCLEGAAQGHEIEEFWKTVYGFVYGVLARNFPAELHAGADVEGIASEALTRIMTRCKPQFLNSPAPGRQFLSLLRKVVRQVMVDERRAGEEYKLYKTLEQICINEPFACVLRGPGKTRSSDLFAHKDAAGGREAPRCPDRMELDRISQIASVGFPLARGAYLPGKTELKKWLEQVFAVAGQGRPSVGSDTDVKEPAAGPVQLRIKDIIYILKRCMAVTEVQTVYLDDEESGAVARASLAVAGGTLAEDVETKIMAEQVVRHLSEKDRLVLGLRSQGYKLANIAVQAGWASPASAKNALEHIFLSIKDAHPQDTPIEEIARVVQYVMGVCGAELKK